MSERRVRRTREAEQMPPQTNGRDRIRLELTPDQLHELVLAIDSRRPSVKVPREALAALLLDHQRMSQKFRGELGGYL